MRLSMVAVVLVVGGYLGATLGGGPKWLIGLTGLGLCGPFILRESGLKPWRDDYQRETVMTAGMHALLTHRRYPEEDPA